METIFNSTFEFSLIRHFNDQRSWYLKITNESQLLDYCHKTNSNIVETIIADFKTNSKDLHTPSEKYLELAKLIAERDQISVVQGLDKLIADISESKFKCLKATGSIFINKHGGYCHFKDEDILKEQTGKLSEWPGDPIIVISQWSTRGHWYAKVNNIDVTIGPEYKWNTKKKAQKAVDTWIESEEL